MRKKKTALQTPRNRKASPNQAKGLVAKGEKSRQSGQEECVLDNRSHRTPRAVPNPSPARVSGGRPVWFPNPKKRLPDKCGPWAARSGTRHVTRLRGAGREEGSKVAGGWGFLPRILAPPIPLKGYRPTAVVARNSTRGQGQKGGKPPVVSPQPSILMWIPTTAA
jgi:hypothetical protein